MEKNAFLLVHIFHSPSKDGCETPENLKIQSQATFTIKAQFSTVAIAGVHKMPEI
jgi:hypothetical protein